MRRTALKLRSSSVDDDKPSIRRNQTSSSHPTRDFHCEGALGGRKTGAFWCQTTDFAADTEPLSNPVRNPSSSKTRLSNALRKQPKKSGIGKCKHKWIRNCRTYFSIEEEGLPAT